MTVVYVASSNALMKVTSWQGTDDEETWKGNAKVSRESGTEVFGEEHLQIW